jgi:hypothetical protein
VHSATREQVDLEPQVEKRTLHELAVTAKLPRLDPGLWKVLVKTDIEGWSGYRPTGASVRVPPGLRRR